MTQNPGIAGVFHCPQGPRPAGFFVSTRAALGAVGTGCQRAREWASGTRAACTRVRAWACGLYASADPEAQPANRRPAAFTGKPTPTAPSAAPTPGPRTSARAATRAGEHSLLVNAGCRACSECSSLFGAGANTQVVDLQGRRVFCSVVLYFL